MVLAERSQAAATTVPGASQVTLPPSRPEPGKPTYITVDGNEAAARVAYRTNEIIAIYPITPSSTMGELADQWAAEGKTNLWGAVPRVVEMQSEGGAAGAVHGALMAGSLATTFTASQGLLLMIPNMYKIAGELTPAVFHVAARAIATHALSIFGDHSDVMAVRQTGFALLASSSVQQAQDLALIAHAATLKSRLPFLHFFDGFRTSHEVMKIEALSDDQIRAMIDESLVRAHRERGLSPDRPELHGAAQNPDVYFQGREAVNHFYDACPDRVQQAMDRFARLTGRSYRLFEYYGDPDATRVVVVMGSAAETVRETVDDLRLHGERVGVLTVHLYRPFSAAHFVRALPATVEAIAVLDRTKEPGSTGEPLYQDVVTALNQAVAELSAPFRLFPRVIGGRYGLASKELTPAMAKAVFDELLKTLPKNGFTIGIQDDVTFTSLDYDARVTLEHPSSVRAVFYGLGSDGTVGANKNSIKIIGEETPNYAQGYFVIDSKKAGSTTVSHLRFGPRPIRAPYLIQSASFVACHQFGLLEQFDVLANAEDGATFLLNSPYGPDEVWDHLPRSLQGQLIDKRIRFYVVDGSTVARKTGMGRRINTVLQTCFFALSGVLPRDEAIDQIKRAIKKTYGKRGEAIVLKNYEAVDQALANLHEVTIPSLVTNQAHPRPPVSEAAPAFVQDVTAMLMAGLGDELPVSAMPVGGVFPTGTAQWEKRNLALEIPVWDAASCIQCGKCVIACPHAAIREKVVPAELLQAAPETFKSAPAQFRQFQGMKYTLQVSPEDCTGCMLCFEACPVVDKALQAKGEVKKALMMEPQPPLREREQTNFEYFLNLPEVDRTLLNPAAVKDAALMEPLFEFSGACAGCGETPYLKLLSQLFGDRAVIANATGCSSIYGGNLPTTPWAKNKDGRGPAWANSLFEDNAEFGLGIRLSIDEQESQARALVQRLAPALGLDSVDVQELLTADQSTEARIKAQRRCVAALKERLSAPDMRSDDAKRLLSLADTLVSRVVWLVGGDGWAYDIGYGGLDHVLASGANLNVLVLDTEVYSNTGGQASKATPRGAVAKFATGGKAMPKKDLGLLAMTYGHIYVARIAIGANDAHTLRVLREAAAYPGPSLVIAYGACIAHGYDLRYSLDHQKSAVASGYWPLYRYNPQLREEGKNPLLLDSKPPTIPFAQYAESEDRYKMLQTAHPEESERLMRQAQADVDAHWALYQSLAGKGAPNGTTNGTQA
ncbi:MAG TPA: pyruvate:ferredoxin (flavodoxin) oxidoreductase [Chloroflexota bacterium]|nr:pyruvate:ferredoxin (flavodoxin) oxidoreductase [Chloroflexota bacterium]